MSVYHGREHGSKIGSGGMATAELAALQRKERIRSIISETYDLRNDPYLFRNQVGGFECRLCGTVHRDEQNYIDHTKGKRHQDELGKRQARLNKERGIAPTAPLVERKKIEPRRTEKIGRPAYKVFKQLSRDTLSHSLLFRVRLSMIFIITHCLYPCGYIIVVYAPIFPIHVPFVPLTCTIFFTPD